MCVDDFDGADGADRMRDSYFGDTAHIGCERAKNEVEFLRKKVDLLEMSLENTQSILRDLITKVLAMDSKRNGR